MPTRQGLFHLPLSKDRKDLIAKTSREAESARKLAIYDRETGLLAHWYFTMRLDEERDRADRYGHEFTLLLIEVEKSGKAADPTYVADRLRENLRASDLGTHLGDDRFLVLLPEAERGAALQLSARLREHTDAMATGIACFPTDGYTSKGLRGAAERDLGAQRTADRIGFLPGPEVQPS